MKDDKGLFYYPYPANKRVKMYVKQQENEIFFRLWKADEPMLWEDHGWVAYSAIMQAMKMYEGKSGFNPRIAYDKQIAQAIIEEGKIQN